MKKEIGAWCCRAMPLSMTREELEEQARRGIGDAPWMISNLVPIGVHKTNPMSGEEYAVPTALYRCQQLQQDGRCGCYETRPKICRDFSCVGHGNFQGCPSKGTICQPDTGNIHKLPEVYALPAERRVTITHAGQVVHEKVEHGVAWDCPGCQQLGNNRRRYDDYRAGLHEFVGKGGKVPINCHGCRTTYGLVKRSIAIVSDGQAKEMIRQMVSGRR